MAWLSRVNFISSDTLSFTDVNNLGNDIRAWGDNVNGGGYTLSNVVLSASAGTMATVIGGTGTTSTLTLRSTSGVGTTGADIIFQTGNNGATEGMRIQNGGNVGIGTSSPSAKLQVVGNIQVGNNTSDWLYLFNTDYGIRASSGFEIQSADFIRLLTNGANERMRIDLNGNVGIGTASASTLLHVKSSSTNDSRIRIDTSSASASPFLEFAENGTVKWYQMNDYATDRLYIFDENLNDGVYLAQNATSWTSNSDARLKNVIGPILGAVEKLDGMNGVFYSWKSDPNNRVYPGVLAQDVQSVLPEAVDSDVPERLGVRYTELIPLLVNAIKELKTEIDNVKARN